ncbi:MAG: alpha-L-fucosidase [Armatimonadetes bacterium]|nr:alpha-L-fucosidase [Armatimonadota bacterium]
MPVALGLLALMSLPLPSPAQAEWLRHDYYAFVHFGPNTFSGLEWGHGTEDPKSFNPKKLDCRQWARAFKSAGMTGVIITAKHHDGFCLWPTKLSTHSVKASTWRDGKGDVLRELSDACRKEGLSFGVYLSPWDRNHPQYGTPGYNDVFVSMLDEVLTRYGKVFEVWFDGANGEGPNGKKQVYDWPRFIAKVRERQPKAVIFSDAGPDVRWVGNENGIAGDPNWLTIRRDRYVPGTPLYEELTKGDADGPDFVPSECDVSIRPGWFWRASEDKAVKSPEALFDLYLKSVGRGSPLLLNVPPNADGLISDADIRALEGFRRLRDEHLGHAVRLRKRGDTFSAPAPVDAAYLELREDLRQGQRVRRVQVFDGETKLAEFESVGKRRIVALPTGVRTKLRLVVTTVAGPENMTAWLHPKR